jgi:hypothetical protein
MITTRQSLDVHSEVEALRPSCWRCSDTGALESRTIVPRRLPCICEIGQREVEGHDYHKRFQSNRFARLSCS